MSLDSLSKFVCYYFIASKSWKLSCVTPAYFKFSFQVSPNPGFWVSNAWFESLTIHTHTHSETHTDTRYTLWMPHFTCFHWSKMLLWICFCMVIWLSMDRYVSYIERITCINFPFSFPCISTFNIYSSLWCMHMYLYDVYTCIYVYVYVFGVCWKSLCATIMDFVGVSSMMGMIGYLEDYLSLPLQRQNTFYHYNYNNR